MTNNNKAYCLYFGATTPQWSNILSKWINGMTHLLQKLHTSWITIKASCVSLVLLTPENFEKWFSFVY